MPVGFFDKYFNDSDDEDRITLTKNQSESTDKLEAVNQTKQKNEQVLTVKQTSDDKQEKDTDLKSRILQAAQQFMVDYTTSCFFH